MDTSLFSGISLDIKPILTSLVDAIKIGLPAMVAISGLKKGVGFIRGSIKG